MSMLIEEAKKLGIEISEGSCKKFEKYFNFLIDYNSRTNLTAITKYEDVIVKHFIDSLALTKFVKIPEKSRIIDVGTGAGFPGVPIKILRPDINLTLLDSLNKRIIFLNELMKEIDEEAFVYHGRAEECGKSKKFRGRYNFVVSRAVANLRMLAEYCLPFVNVNGRFISLKGTGRGNEIKDAENAIKILGGEIEKIKKFELPLQKGSRSIIVIKKIKPTPHVYLRSNSQISKKPI